MKKKRENKLKRDTEGRGKTIRTKCYKEERGQQEK
jgi:hypothetical protein